LSDLTQYTTLGAACAALASLVKKLPVNAYACGTSVTDVVPLYSPIGFAQNWVLHISLDTSKTKCPPEALAIIAAHGALPVFLETPEGIRMNDVAEAAEKPVKEKKPRAPRAAKEPKEPKAPRPQSRKDYVAEQMRNGGVTVGGIVAHFGCTPQAARSLVNDVRFALKDKDEQVVREQVGEDFAYKIAPRTAAQPETTGAPV
jgi:hypothetical protein